MPKVEFISGPRGESPSPSKRSGESRVDNPATSARQIIEETLLRRRFGHYWDIAELAAESRGLAYQVVGRELTNEEIAEAIKQIFLDGIKKFAIG